jgi:hypothetical protein
MYPCVRGVKHMILKALAIVSIPVLLSTAAISAESAPARLENVAGKVLINQGKGFVPANAAASIAFGTKIMVGANSQATLTFAKTKSHKGCSIVLDPTSVTTVSDIGMCDTQLGAMDVTADQAIITPTASSAPPSTIPPQVVALGFVAVVAGAAIYSLTQSDAAISGP